MRKICLIREIILILHRKSETHSNIRKCAYIYAANEFFQISLVGGIVFWGMVMLRTLAIVHKGNNDPKLGTWGSATPRAKAEPELRHKVAMVLGIG